MTSETENERKHNISNQIEKKKRNKRINAKRHETKDEEEEEQNTR